MLTFKLLLGVLFFIFAWVLLFKPNLLLNLNRVIRERVFNDRIILMERKKLSVFFFCLSILALYIGLTALIKSKETQGKDNWIIERNKFTMYLAMQEYCDGKYAEAIEKYKKILESDIGSEQALKHLALSYEAVGDIKSAKEAWIKLLRLNPGDVKTLEKLKELETSKIKLKDSKKNK